MNEANKSDRYLKLAMALHSARAPKSPFPDRDMPTPTLARAKAGSDRDAQLALLMMELLLERRLPSPFEHAAIVPAWAADEIRELLKRAREVAHPSAAFGHRRARGRHGRWDHAERDACIDHLARLYRYAGHRDYLHRTAQALARANEPPPSLQNGWSSQAVKDAIAAHVRRGTIP